MITKLNNKIVAGVFYLLLLSFPPSLLSSCSEKDSPVNNNPLAEKFEGVWYAEYAKEGSLPGLIDSDPDIIYNKVIHVYKFNADGTGSWEKFYLNDDEPVYNQAEVALGKLVDADGAFHYSTAADGTINITLDKPKLFDDADNIPAAWSLHCQNESISGTDGAIDYTLTQADEAQRQRLFQYAYMMHLGDEDVNPNDAPDSLGFNNKNWRTKETIYIFDGKDHQVGPYKGYKRIGLPWSKTVDTQINMPVNFCDDITPENGWELALNRCGYSNMENENFFFLYNKYTGILRAFYYLPDEFQSGNDHVWQVSLTDNAAHRSIWRYALSEDEKITDKAAIGQTAAGNMVNLVTPWVSTEQVGAGGVIVPNAGWWTFDVDMSTYRPGLDISKDKITMRMLSVNKSQVSLFSNIEAKIEGSIELKNVLSEAGCNMDAINGVHAGAQMALKLINGIVAFDTGKTADGFDALVEAFGLGGNLAGIIGGTEVVTGYHGNLELGLHGTIDTEGFISAAAPTQNIVSPTIPMSVFDTKNTHFGQGVWNLKTAPVIYLTNQLLYIAEGGGGGFYTNDRTTYTDKYTGKETENPSQYGCVWFLDPTSIDLDLNPNVFPQENIEWMQVDFIPIARMVDGLTISDPYRKGFGLSERKVLFTDGKDYKGGADYIAHLDDENFYDYYPWFFTFGNMDSWAKTDVLGDFYYELSDEEKENLDTSGRPYSVKTKCDTIDNRIQRLYGRGEFEKYILEPQISLPVWYESCMAPAVEISVQVSIKLKGKAQVYVFNRVYLPEFKLMQATEDNLTKFYNDIKAHQLGDKYKGHRAIYDYHVKRTYDKVKAIFPDANLK